MARRAVTDQFIVCFILLIDPASSLGRDSRDEILILLDRDERVEAIGRLTQSLRVDEVLQSHRFRESDDVVVRDGLDEVLH